MLGEARSWGKGGTFYKVRPLPWDEQTLHKIANKMDVLKGTQDGDRNGNDCQT